MTLKRAIVTAVGPLRILIDGDTVAIPFTPKSFVDPSTLAVDDIVGVDLSGNRLWVLGRVGGLVLSDASTTVKGIVELATDAETITGTDTARAVTPAGLAAVRARVAQGVIPSSVAVGSGSASVDADGLVTFTGVSSLSLNDVFDGVGGDMYELYVRAVSSTGATQIMRMRASGTDYSGGGYDRTAIFSNGGSPLTSANSADTGFCYLSPTGTGPGGPISCRTLFTEPGKSGKTVSVHQATANVRNSVYIWSEAGAVSAGAYDGIALITSAGTITGTVKVVKIA